MEKNDQRREVRDSFLLVADLSVEGYAEAVQVKVRNLSSGGMMGESTASFLKGDKVNISIRNLGHIDGTVVWVQESRFGIMFDRPIDVKQIRTTTQSEEHHSPRYARPVVRTYKAKNSLRSL